MLLLVHVLGIAAVYTVGVLTGAFVMRVMHKEFEKRGISSVPTAADKKQILEFVKREGRVTNDDVQALLKISDSTAQRYLGALDKSGEISRHGKTRDIHYTLAQK